MFSKPAKVAAVGALALGMGAEAVSPAAKQTYQEIMRADCNAPFRQMVMPHHPDKGGNIDDFSFVESARQSRKGNCGPNTQTTKPKTTIRNIKKKMEPTTARTKTTSQRRSYKTIRTTRKKLMQGLVKIIVKMTQNSHLIH